MKHDRQFILSESLTFKVDLVTVDSKRILFDFVDIIFYTDEYNIFWYWPMAIYNQVPCFEGDCSCLVNIKIYAQEKGNWFENRYRTLLIFIN